MPLWGGSLPPGTILNRTLLYAAARKAGFVLRPGTGLAPEEFDDAIAEENRMIGGWNLSPLTMLGERIDLWDTIPRQQSYTLGRDPSGILAADWDGERPQKILRANLLLPTAADPITKIRRDIDVVDKNGWGSIVFQAVYTYPNKLYPLFNDPEKTPFSRLYFHPIPDAAYQIELFTLQRIPKFASLDDIVLLPDGWEDAIVNNLAVRLGSMPWGLQVPMNPQVAVDARSSLQLLKQFNASAPDAVNDADFRSGGGRYNFRTGMMDA